MDTTIDKSREITATIKSINDRLHFEGLVQGNAPVSIDYIPPLGDNLGYTSLELLLLSLGSCIQSNVIIFLRKMRKTVNGCEIMARGLRREEHPTGFHTIFIDIAIASPDTADEDVEKILTMAEEKYCPVWNMLRGNVAVKTNFQIRK